MINYIMVNKEFLYNQTLLLREALHSLINNVFTCSSSVSWLAGRDTLGDG